MSERGMMVMFKVGFWSFIVWMLCVSIRLFLLPLLEG